VRGQGNNLTQAPAGGAAGGPDNLANATAASILLGGHKVYGVYVAPGTGYRDDHTSGIATTPVWDQVATPEAKQARLADMAARLPGKRIGRPSDIGNAVAFLISDEFITGTVLHAEGAQLLV
jgi:NAD(P)-dependent dehydrogenase (short-subunit alcohol dehydrogenase family)